MKLLKLGMLDMQSDRWLDALDVFDSVTVIKSNHVEKQVEGINYYEFNTDSMIRRILMKFIRYFNDKPKCQFFEKACLSIFRLTLKQEKKYLEKLEYDEIHVSYNDYDESALLLSLFKPFLKRGVRITRAYKETRPEFKFLERSAFENSNRVVLNAKENVDFFEKKYGEQIFKNKEVIYGLDEDAIGKKYINGIKYIDKLSQVDGKPHVVILAGRVFSDSLDKRSGSRLFYLPIIEDCIRAGLIVHLHTLKIYVDSNGVNQYEEMKKRFPDSFFIEAALDFSGENWKTSYSILSRYDYGVLHNFIDGTSNTEFDKYNIPHRYYEYQLAHVAPLLLSNKTIVMQRIMEEQNTGVIYQNLNELHEQKPVTFRITCFADYIKELYG